MVVACWCGRSSRPEISTDRHSALFKTLKPLIALRSAHTVLSVCLVKQLKCICKIFTKFASKFHTLTFFFKLFVTLSLIRRTACARAEFSGCSSTTNAHSETGEMAVCCQNLALGAPSSHSALSMLVGALFKKFGLFLNTPLIMIQYSLLHVPAVDRHLQAVRTVITIWYQSAILTLCNITSQPCYDVQYMHMFSLYSTAVRFMSVHIAGRATLCHSASRLLYCSGDSYNC